MRFCCSYRSVSALVSVERTEGTDPVLPVLGSEVVGRIPVRKKTHTKKHILIIIIIILIILIIIILIIIIIILIIIIVILRTQKENM
ncbi:hypothetical protein EYF80_064282 [Liparis tanakae]|uniref:Uncharacterized protein n=1 Tax=Liparis tanakae TaxID=230148 RepID=A0A4Z2E9Q0_9TELE|nr:hypothetical protein EYF80_064282 [Liparis tanakae]